jgi:hypothetical protein
MLCPVIIVLHRFRATVNKFVQHLNLFVSNYQSRIVNRKLYKYEPVLFTYYQ